ncbi:helix-turn-helix transcriptional regulator [Natronospora cellulosivora (SeqCode)]
MEKKNKVHRILKIISLLSSKYKKWSAKKLAELFSVSERTIYRDINTMEDMGVPIYYDEEKCSYVIAEKFYLSPPDINRSEALALLLVGQVFEDESFLYRQELDTAIAKIINSLPESIQNLLAELGNSISYHKGAVVDINPYREFISIIKNSIKDSKSITIGYHSLKRDEIISRKINPYTLTIKKGAYYLIGYCHLRCEIRMFRVDRISNINIMSEKFIKADDFDIEDYLDDVWGVERGRKKYRVKVIFKGIAARLVKEMIWHQKQRITDLPGKRIKFEITTGSFEEIKSWILGYGANAEVISPEELKEAVRKEIGKMKEIYG